MNWKYAVIRNEQKIQQVVEIFNTFKYDCCGVNLDCVIYKDDNGNFREAIALNVFRDKQLAEKYCNKK